MSGRLEEAVAKAVRKVRVDPDAINHDHQPHPQTRTQRLRERHQTTARMVAAKMSDERICFAMGMSLQNLRLLKEQTPAFQELVWFYEQQPDLRTAEVEDYLEQKARVARLAQLELLDRVIEDPSKFSSSELLRIQADYDDRTGFSKQSVNVNVNLDLAARLEHARRQRALAGAGDGGGASSSVVGSAPPLLDLKANSPEPINSSQAASSPEPVATPHPQEPPAPPKPRLYDAITAGRTRYVPEVKEKMRRI